MRTVKPLKAFWFVNWLVLGPMDYNEILIGWCLAQDNAHSGILLRGRMSSKETLCNLRFPRINAFFNKVSKALSGRD